MPEHILFLTGRLARPSLERVLRGMASDAFTYVVHDLGLSVAALMTCDMIRRRLENAQGVDRILVPGLCSGPVSELESHFGVAVQRGPKDLKDLPEFFGMGAAPPDLSRYAVKIFAEIVDAPNLTTAEIVARAARYRDDGADVIDLGCLPEQPFARLEEAVQALKKAGFRVSVDSMNTDELLRGGGAGADYLLSVKESTLWVADEVPSIPVLIPEEPGDLESLVRAMELLRDSGRDFLADSILDPIHFGFTESLLRYAALRARFPEAEMMVGTGNVTELTDADTTGMGALLLGICSELDASAILTTEVSPHARSAVREADLARRIMFAAKRDASLPRKFHPGLMALRDRKPFTYTSEEIAETAGAIKDRNFRVQVNEKGIHVYNRDGLRVGCDPFELWPRLGLGDDASHAFYMGVELGRAQIAWQLGKRYMQDRTLAWGCAVVEEDSLDEGYDAPGSTLASRRRNRRKRRKE